MTICKALAALLALAGTTLPAFSQAADDIAGLRAELQALKNEYQARVGALEQRLAQLESAPVAGLSEPAATSQPADLASQPVNRATAFNPAMSLILAGSYTDTSQDPQTWGIAGFIPNDGELGPGERSFNLGESELTLSANVDPYFAGQMTAALTPENEVEVEEAFFRTLALPSGFTAKGGRFFSGFGYLNEVHAHAWDFADQPLAYQAFFAGQFKQEGLQIKWLAPTELFVELGAETGNGSGFPATRRNRNGFNGATLFAHVGGDVDDSISWRAGAAYLDQRAQDRTFENVDEFDLPVINSFTGDSRTWVVDAVLKWSPVGDPNRRQLKVQGEYMRRRESGLLTFNTDGSNLTDDYRSSQSGWYVQGVYQFLPRWRAGLRYDALDSGAPSIGLVDSGELPLTAFPTLLSADPDRISIMLDWNPSEFTRLRAQYDWDDARGTDDRDRIFRLQYIYGIGAHGAHKY
ncbi:MAG TPA: TonB-dependent receptor [Steroidobacteraceae bacterium]|nr:TonB-dependent receptor [Steroidobacteraceae bacterium]